MNFSIAPVFSDGMVLQRDKNINVFGEGCDGETVLVEFDGSAAKTVVKNGKWLAVLPEHAAGEGYTMTVSCADVKKTFSDIAVGEVWLAGGQSNMEFELQNCTGGAERLKNDVTPNVRFYYTPKIVKGEPDYDEKMRNTRWEHFSEQSARYWSAVGYFFAKELADKLGCTVGIIGCNWGGTKASHWMSRESLSHDDEMRFDLDEYDKCCEGKTPDELTKMYRDYEDYNNAWNTRKEEYYAKTPNASWEECLKLCGECRYPGPPCPLNPFRATALYESMLMKVCPYTLKGFMYYQGESDDPRPESYFKLLRGLIGLWREDWGDDELPFLIVQLPMHRYEGDLDRKNWCIIREAQEKVFRTTRNTGLAVILDCGEFNEIHPRDKVPVGHRLFLQAMSCAYGEYSPDKFSPLYKSHIIKENGIEVSFEYADGFTVKGTPCGFELAGADGEYKPAEFEIRGDKIFVFSGEIPAPLNVRYEWTNYGEVTLFGTNGLPVAPFRTDKKAVL